MKHDFLISELAERLDNVQLYLAEHKNQHDLLIQQIFLKLSAIYVQNEEILKNQRRLENNVNPGSFKKDTRSI